MCLWITGTNNLSYGILTVAVRIILRFCVYLRPRNNICSLYLVVESTSCGFIHWHAPVMEWKEAALLVGCGCNSEYLVNGSKHTTVLWHRECQLLDLCLSDFVLATSLITVTVLCPTNQHTLTAPAKSRSTHSSFAMWFPFLTDIMTY